LVAKPTLRLTLETRGEETARKVRAVLPQLLPSAQAFLLEAVAERRTSGPRQ